MAGLSLSPWTFTDGEEASEVSLSKYPLGQVWSHDCNEGWETCLGGNGNWFGK